MTWSEYVDQCVKDLAMARSTDDFRNIVSGIERNLNAWGTNRDNRQWFWGEVQVRYEKAPKLVLKDTTAAARLYDLHRVASQMLATAQQQSLAAASPGK
ncbi:MAG TPA: hypothetical protein VFZ09_46400 [Archangium sp.]|uniref:hypothetical protein n=1 Tax=Archangium sp. TaxID=1872627 RepID=UPI002E2FA5AB|nr:hypothetical protein [Archangium sp.]HEX5753710.1 hypothetical protein [Archangium sp.]